MGLVKVFSAQEEVWWRGFEEPEGTDPTKTFDRWGFEHGKNDRVGWVNWPTMPPPYSPDLVTAPRAYGEEPFVRYSSGSHPMYGALWAQNEGGSTSSINVFLSMRQAVWPSWNVSRWKFDGSTGACLRRMPLKAGGIEGDGSVVYDRFTAETISGRLWWFGVHATGYHHAIVEVDPTTLEQIEQHEIPLGAFEAAPGLMLQNEIAALAIDHVQKRAYVRWTASPLRCVHAYDLVGGVVPWKWAHDIYAGSAVDQVLMTDTGVVYLIDQNDWLTQYSASGRYLGAVRNPRTVAWPFGYMYGWDRFYRRLLFVAGTENAPDGASTLRVEGFYPIPEATRLSPPIPLSRLRKGRRVALLSQVSGQGGEPMGAVNAMLALGGAPAAFVSADSNGDLVFRVTPSTAGPLTAEVTAPWP